MDACEGAGSADGGGDGKLPVNVRVILRARRKLAGRGLRRLCGEHPERLKADVALVSDTEMFAPELPTLCVGLRGMIYTEIEVRGAKTDLHSGMYGGAAPNPFVGLAQMIAKLKDGDGKFRFRGSMTMWRSRRRRSEGVEAAAVR